jgi:hypothetical protein
MVKNIFDGWKNLLHRENAMGSSALVVVINMKLDARKTLKKSNRELFVAAELGHVSSMVCSGRLFDMDDPQRFVWFGRAANWDCVYFLNEMSDQIRNFNSETGCHFLNWTSFERTYQQREANNLWNNLQF